MKIWSLISDFKVKSTVLLNRIKFSISEIYIVRLRIVRIQEKINNKWSKTSRWSLNLRLVCSAFMDPRLEFRLFFTCEKIYTAMNTAMISWMLSTFVSIPVVDAIKSQRRSWLSLRAYVVMSATWSPADKVARFNRGLVKRFLRGCVNEAASKHLRNINNVTDLGCYSIIIWTHDEKTCC